MNNRQLKFAAGNNVRLNRYSRDLEPKNFHDDVGVVVESTFDFYQDAEIVSVTWPNPEGRADHFAYMLDLVSAGPEPFKLNEAVTLRGRPADYVGIVTLPEFGTADPGLITVAWPDGCSTHPAADLRPALTSIPTFFDEK